MGRDSTHINSNIIRPQHAAASGKRVNVYLGSGRMGECFNATGLMDETPDPNARRVGQTVLVHSDYQHRGTFG